MVRRRFLLFCFMFFMLFSSFCTIAMGANSKIQEESKRIINLNKGGQISGPVFSSSDGYWYPGYSKTNEFIIRNTSSYNYNLDKISMTISLKNLDGRTLDTGSIEYRDFIEYMELELKNGGNRIYSGKFKDIIGKDGNISPRDGLLPHSDSKYQLTIKMNYEAGATLYNLRCDFSIMFSCSGYGDDGYDSRNDGKHKKNEVTITTVNEPELPEQPIDEPEDIGDSDSHVESAPGEIPAAIPKTGSMFDTGVLVSAGLVFVSIGSLFTFGKSK